MVAFSGSQQRVSLHDALHVDRASAHHQVAGNDGRTGQGDAPAGGYHVVVHPRADLDSPTRDPDVVADLARYLHVAARGDQVAPDSPRNVDGAARRQHVALHVACQVDDPARGHKVALNRSEYVDRASGEVEVVRHGLGARDRDLVAAAELLRRAPGYGRRENDQQRQRIESAVHLIPPCFKAQPILWRC